MKWTMKFWGKLKKLEVVLKFHGEKALMYMIILLLILLLFLFLFLGGYWRRICNLCKLYSRIAGPLQQNGGYLNDPLIMLLSFPFNR